MNGVNGDLIALKKKVEETKRRMTFECNGITIGQGREEWGAPDHETFIIKLGNRIGKL